MATVTASSAPAILEIMPRESSEAEDMRVQENLESEPEQDVVAAAAAVSELRSRAKRPKSKYAGVHRNKTTPSFIAQIYDPSLNGMKHLGSFKFEVDAAKAYDTAARAIGRPKNINFPTAEEAAVIDLLRKKRPVYGRSKYNGVNRNKGMFQATIQYSCKSRYLGLFKTEEEAAKAYDAEARKIWRIGKLNFPTAEEEELRSKMRCFKRKRPSTSTTPVKRDAKARSTEQ